MPKPVLVTQATTASIPGRIRQALYDRIQAVQGRLRELGCDAVFPVDQIIEDALQRATRLAEAELSHRSQLIGAPTVAN